MPEESEPKSPLPAHFADVGGTIYTASNVNDAAALALAGNILDEVELRKHPRELIQSLATILDKYSLNRAAKVLRERHLN